MNWAALDFTALANAVLALLTATIVLLATQIGRKAKSGQTPAQLTPGVEMQGAAIISNEPMKMLISAIEAGNMEGIQLRTAVTKLTEAIVDQTDEMKEMRNEMARRR
ncbi:hypothetical protein NGM99_13655 [Mesorhizobium sp. RP14(2022)]|uniref:Phage holin family protein n=1 Tax=Mesorhizobium liriopis TaxID=2953882 RepID=A0ABT1C7L1_9HYPH|nr:hypothetical protein [Mesorhizobium liriopis]MCO6050824.1 hypothetical protein [Mesorhizobium liriopis]